MPYIILLLLVGHILSEAVVARLYSECVCGRIPYAPSPRIAGGIDAIKNAYPWQVAIFTELGQFYCGGSIISKRHFLTAAHCAYNLDTNNWYVILGMHDLIKKDGHRYEISMIISHPEYNTMKKNQVAFDIAIGVLARNILFTYTVWPICMPPNQNTTYDGEKGTITGWGRLAHKGKRPRILQVGVVDLIKIDDCLKTRVGKVIVPDVMLCAYTPNVDACQGDSGGPIFLKNNDDYYELVGVTSFGIGCATPNSAGVYTKLTYFLNWIEDMILRTAPNTVCKNPTLDMHD